MVLHLAPGACADDAAAGETHAFGRIDGAPFAVYQRTKIEEPAAHRIAHLQLGAVGKVLISCGDRSVATDFLHQI